MRKMKVLFAILTVALVLTGCASGFTRVAAQRPGENEPKLGAAKGKACGVILIGPTAYNVIPAGLNTRVERAYRNALASVPGATGLVNVTLQESWFWFVAGTARCTTITGEGVR